MQGMPPSFLQPFLWSYDLGRMDIERDKNTIIKHVLDYGTAEATEWLQKNYNDADIRDTIATTPSSDWNRKSLALWQLVYNVRPTREGRFI